jgi:hypothetical protein
LLGYVAIMILHITITILTVATEVAVQLELSLKESNINKTLFLLVVQRVHAKNT